MINYVRGDATLPIGGGPKFVIHCCNDLGLWGSGFVLAVSRRWGSPKEGFYSPEDAYYSLDKFGKGFPLGLAQHVRVDEDLWVVNMIGQSGVGPQPDGPPVRYDAIRTALKSVALNARHPDFRGPFKAVSVHAPRFGAGLAGGQWSIIEELIDDELVDKGIEVTIYDFNG